MKGYSEYKDSGVAWIGKVPSHWQIFALKRAVEGCVNGIWGDEPDGLNDIFVLRVADFDRNSLRVSERKLTIRSVSPKERSNRILKVGDLLLEKSGGGEKNLVGCTVLFDKKINAVTSNFVAKMTPKDGFFSNFLNYAFSHLYSLNVNYMSINQTTGIQNIDSSKYLGNMFCFPDVTDQQAIASFLDRETARIDQLIAEKQNFINLLKEKRQALISHVVTKGLDPKVKMKDSGIEWIGEVPEHWECVPLKRLVRNIEQGWSPECHSNSARENCWGVLKSGAVNGGIYKDQENKELPETLSPRPEIEVKKGDLIMSRASGSRELIGSAAYVYETRSKLMLSDKLFRLNCLAEIDPEFVAICLSSYPLRRQIELAIGGAEGLANNLSQSNIKKLFLVKPPMVEQKVIVSRLKERLARFDSIVAETYQSVDLLREHRTALISAAVTGKIDVRHKQAVAA